MEANTVSTEQAAPTPASQKPVLVIYHANCSDGFAAAWVCWTKFGKNADYLGWQYQKGLPPREVLEGRHSIYVVDFSFPLHELVILSDYATELVILDHHAGMKQELEQFDDWAQKNVYSSVDVHYADDMCGALMTWKHLYEDAPVPLLLDYIDDYDRWVFKYADTKQVIKGLRARPMDFVEWNNLMHAGSAGIAILVRDGEVIDGWTAPMFTYYAERAERTTLETGEEVMLVNAPPFLQSELGHLLSNTHGIPALMYMVDRGGMLICSMRGTAEHDVSVICKKYGGGGHKAAAGFKVNHPVWRSPETADVPY